MLILLMTLLKDQNIIVVLSTTRPDTARVLT